MTPQKDKKPRWARNLAAPERDVFILLNPVSEDLRPTPETTIAVLRVACEPYLANQSSPGYPGGPDGRDARSR
jgi:hypothetical protein